MVMSARMARSLHHLTEHLLPGAPMATNPRHAAIFENPLEQLEKREFLSTTVSSLSVLPEPATAGVAATVVIEASATGGVRAVTIFRDVDGNGRWTAGVDQSLGDIFAASSDGKFRRAIVPQVGWGRSVRIVADAVSNTGQWTGAPRGLTFVNNTRPTATLANLSTSMVARGGSVTVTMDATDDTSVRAMTAFLDVDGNGVWTPGVDRSLGNAYTRDVGTGRFSITFAAGAELGNGGTVRVDAVDADGAWTGAPRSAGAFTINTPPVLGAVRAQWENATPSTPRHGLTLSVNATDDVGVRAVTFFLDLDGNGAWTAGVDQSLADVFTPVNGSTYRATVYTDLAGLTSASIVADAVDTQGLWTGSRPSATVTPLRSSQVVSFYVDTTSGVSLAAEAWVPPSGSSGAAQVSGVDYYADVNQNGVVDAGDQLVATGTVGTLQASGAWRYLVRLNSTQIASLPSSPYGWLAAARVSTGDGGFVLGPARMAIARSWPIGTPTVTRVLVNTDASATIGDAWSVSVTGFAGGGLTGITLFFDTNHNGQWDAGIDIDLGFNTADANPGTVTFSGTYSEAMRRGGAFTAAALVRSGGTDTWSVTRSARPQTIIAGPSTTLVGTPSVSGNTITLEVDAVDDFAVRTINVWIDLNNDGIRDPGERMGTATLIAGSRSSGRWRLTIDLGVAPSGSYTLAWQGVDYSRGLGGNGIVGALGSVSFNA
jgi:hypothetical protein